MDEQRAIEVLERLKNHTEKTMWMSHTESRMEHIAAMAKLEVDALGMAIQSLKEKLAEKPPY